MRFIHLADLHFGKNIYGTSLIENGDQSFWVDRFLEVVDDKKPDAVVIAGDVFDRSAPSEDAVKLFNRMVTSLHAKQIPVLTVAGNHDSVYRLSYLGDILSELGVHFSDGLGDGLGENDHILNHVTLSDEFGPVTFWLMPYVFPALIQKAIVQNVIGDSDSPEIANENHISENLRDYDSAVRALLSLQPINSDERNILIAHQNVTANGVEAERGGSESMVGGVGQIDYTAFDSFEYVALGHIHSAYPVGRESVRYAGTPMCYHFEELRQKAKGPVLVTLRDKGTTPEIEILKINPLHPMRDIRGHYGDIVESELASTATGEYIRITIDDQRITPEISQFFRDLYSGRDSMLMELKSEYSAFTGDAGKVTSEKIASLSVEELFAEFYRERKGQEDPSDEDIELMRYAGELMRHEDVKLAPEAPVIDKLLKHLLEAEA